MYDSEIEKLEPKKPGKSDKEITKGLKLWLMCAYVFLRNVLRWIFEDCKLEIEKTINDLIRDLVNDSSIMEDECLTKEEER